jgi:hypothetical protein
LSGADGRVAITGELGKIKLRSSSEILLFIKYYYEEKS